ncbi:MAG: hypothetical protein HY847_07025 [Betaproteobacteria bacterium]|nr:hypothetical protein [Betaproteobacteria bacterium]
MNRNASGFIENITIPRSDAHEQESRHQEGREKAADQNRQREKSRKEAEERREQAQDSGLI